MGQASLAPEGRAAQSRGWPVQTGQEKDTLQAAVSGNVLIRGFLDTVVHLLPTIPY